MKVAIDTEILTILPNLKIGTILYKHITVGTSPQMIRGRLQLYQESIALELENKAISEYKGVTEWRNTFKKLGLDPSKYRPSHEALVRRISKRKFLTSVNSATDINNFFSVQYGLPIGIYDFDKIGEQIIIRLGLENEFYDGLNNREISTYKKLVAADVTGPFGSPLTDSKRTAVTEDTKNAIQIIYLGASFDIKSANKLLQAMSKMFTQVNGGIAESSLIPTIKEQNN